MLLRSSNSNSQESQGRINDFGSPGQKGLTLFIIFFFNLLYWFAIVVELGKMPVGASWTMPQMKTDDVKREDLDCSKSPMPLGQMAEMIRHT